MKTCLQWTKKPSSSHGYAVSHQQRPDIQKIILQDDALEVEEELREEIKQLQIRGADFWTPDEVR